MKLIAYKILLNVIFLNHFYVPSAYYSLKIADYQLELMLQDHLADQ